MEFRCSNVQWKHKARDTLKKLCNRCSDLKNIDNPEYKQPRNYKRKEAGKPLTENDRKRRHLQRHPKYPCRFCQGEFKTDKHKKIKGKNGAKGYCKSCAKLHKEIINREEAGEDPLALQG